MLWHFKTWKKSAGEHKNLIIINIWCYCCCCWRIHLKLLVPAQDVQIQMNLIEKYMHIFKSPLSVYNKLYSIYNKKIYRKILFSSSCLRQYVTTNYYPYFTIYLSTVKLTRLSFIRKRVSSIIRSPVPGVRGRIYWHFSSSQSEQVNGSLGYHLCP